jgi:hypothetical protein
LTKFQSPSRTRKRVSYLVSVTATLLISDIYVRDFVTPSNDNSAHISPSSSILVDSMAESQTLHSLLRGLATFIGKGAGRFPPTFFPQGSTSEYLSTTLSSPSPPTSTIHKDRLRRMLAPYPA